MGDRIPTVLFVLPSLAWGGAQRTLLNIINHLDRKHFRPVLALYRKEGAFVDFLQRDVAVYELRSSRARFSIPGLAWVIRSLRPDIIISTLRYANVTTMLSAVLSGKKIPVVLRESNHQTAAGVGTTPWKERLVGWSYRRASRVIALSNGVRKDVLARYKLQAESVVTIYNPIDIERILQLAIEPVNDPGFNHGSKGEGCFKIIAVGALEYQKGYDLLIEALARVRHIPYRLWILGDGRERQNLVALANRRGINDRISLIGFQPNPYAWMARADLFVLSSRWEGFGHVIAEAMACGTPVLAARCQAGPDEIITDDTDGRLCEQNSVSALACTIEELWRDLAKRKHYAATARESVRRFDTRIIVKDYERLFSEVASG